MYDEKCDELARYFLSPDGEPKEAEVASLAQHIQSAIEDWLGAPEIYMNSAPAGLILTDVVR